MLDSYKQRLAALVLFAIAGLFWAGPAFAHAVLLETSPPEGQVMEAAPEHFELRFNEPVSLLLASLITPAGEQIDIAPGAEDGETVRFDLPADLGQGTHVVSWRVVSTDGHPIGGAATFSVGVVTGGAADVVAGDPVVVTLLWAGKAVLYAALFFGLGTAAFGLFMPLPGAAVAFARGAAIVGLGVAPLTLGLQGVDALALGIDGLFGADAWRGGFATSYGATILTLVGALAAALVSLWAKPAGVRRAAMVLAWAGAALAFILSGHASAAQPQWLTRMAVFVHVAGIVFWVGALVPLAVMLLRRDAAMPAALARFSALIVYPVGLIVVSGVTLALIQLGRDPGQWMAPYGLILAAKLGLLALLFGLAVWNRLALTRPAVAGEARAIGMLRASMSAEIVLVLVILGLVAGWRFTPPPRALAEMASVPVTFHIHTGTVMADVEMTPGRPGSNTVAAFLMDGNFGPVDPAEVTVVLSAPDMGIEAQRLPATLEEDGYWRVHDVTVPIAGDWLIELEIRLSRFEMTRLSHSFTLNRTL